MIIMLRVSKKFIDNVKTVCVSFKMKYEALASNEYFANILSSIFRRNIKTNKQQIVKMQESEEICKKRSCGFQNMLSVR